MVALCVAESPSSGMGRGGGGGANKLFIAYRVSVFKFRDFRLLMIHQIIKKTS